MPKRGEIWLVSLDPTIGSEIRKTRPAIVISGDTIGQLPIKLIVPITDWKSNFHRNVWHTKLKPTASNGLSKISTADTLQMRSVDLRRFVLKIGCASSQTIVKVTASIVAVVEADSL
jgi:mRNA interferase MazF